MKGVPIFFIPENNPAALPTPSHEVLQGPSLPPSETPGKKQVSHFIKSTLKPQDIQHPFLSPTDERGREQSTLPSGPQTVLLVSGIPLLYFTLERLVDQVSLCHFSILHPHFPALYLRDSPYCI